MTVVGVTGISGSLGRQLLQQLEVDPDVTAVVGLDLQPVPDPALKLSFYQHDVSQPFGELFQRHKVQVAIHLAAVSDPDRAREEATNVAGTREFLAACHQTGARVVCVLSDAMAYGVRPGPAEVQYEGAALHPEGAPSFVRDKAAMEDLCYEYVKAHPDTCLQIVRPCLVVGPNSANFLTRLLESRLVLAPLGADPPLQLVHEDDATRAIYRLVKTERVGVFNLAGDGVLTLGQMARLAERRVLRLPLPLLRLLSWLGWRLGLRLFPRVPGALWSFLRWPWLIAPLKLRQEIGLLFRYDSAQAFLDWLEAQSGGELPRQIGWAPLDDELDELDDEDLLPPESELPAVEVRTPGWGDTARGEEGDDFADGPTPRVHMGELEGDEAPAGEPPTASDPGAPEPVTAPAPEPDAAPAAASEPVAERAPPQPAAPGGATEPEADPGAEGSAVEADEADQPASRPS